MADTMSLVDIGITPRKAAQFAAKGIETVQDLLMFYPTKYLDFRNPVNLADGKQYAGKHVAVKGQVVGSRIINGKHFMLRLSDGNHFCSVFWFNQPFRAKQFCMGQIYNGVIITKDHRYVKILEFRPINFGYMDAETQNRIISLFYQTFKAVPVNIQFKTFARKADVEKTIATVTSYYREETNIKRKRMLKAYIGLLRKTALSVGITRRFFIIIEFQRTISNDGSNFDMVVADLNAMAANVRSHMEQCGNIFIPALGDSSRNEDAGIHQLFYHMLTKSRKAFLIS